MGPVYSLPFPLALIVFVSFISFFSRRSLSASPVKKELCRQFFLFLLFFNLIKGYPYYICATI